jgi:hypothetical protein
MQIPYSTIYQKMKKALSLNDVDFYESFQFGQRQLITGFVGNSFSFGPRKMLQYFSKYNNVYIHYNELYWVNLFTNKNYLDLVEREHYYFLQNTIFSFCPRGFGVSSIRLFESIAYGAIPILLDDDVLPI